MSLLKTLLDGNEREVKKLRSMVETKINPLEPQFEKLIAIPERGVFDPKLADELFPKWLERNQTLYTNALPMRWTVQPEEQPAVPARRGRRRG